jgi:hypothetical protein
MARQPLTVTLPKSEPSLHLCPEVESRAATIAAVGLVSAAVSCCTWAAACSCTPCKTIPHLGEIHLRTPAGCGTIPLRLVELGLKAKR